MFLIPIMQEWALPALDLCVVSLVIQKSKLDERDL